jgi:copper chaperone
MMSIPSEGIDIICVNEVKLMKITLSAPDIVCQGCANAIKKAVGTLPGVSETTVDITAKTVTITHEAPTTRETITNTLERAGFPAS